MLPRARLRLPPIASLRRPADHRRLGVPVDRPARLGAGLLDRPGGRPPPAPVGGHRPDRRRPDPGAAGPAARQRGRAAVGVRRRLRLRPAHLGPGRGTRSSAGAAARRPLLLRRPASATTGQHGPAAPPRRQVHLRRPDHLAGPHRDPSHQQRPVRRRDRGRLERAASQTTAPPWPGQPRPRPIVRGTVIRVQVERVPAKTRPPKVLWLWWAGPAGCPLDLKRFARSGDMIGPLLAAWPDETNRLSPQRPWSARPPGLPWKASACKPGRCLPPATPKPRSPTSWASPARTSAAGTPAGRRADCRRWPAAAPPGRRRAFRTSNATTWTRRCARAPAPTASTPTTGPLSASPP